MSADMFQVSQKNQHGNLLLDVRAISVVLLENAMLRNNDLMGRIGVEAWEYW